MTPLVLPVDLGAGLNAVVTGRDPDAPSAPVGSPGNLSHRRPHRPDDLAAARAAVGRATATDPGRWHLMQQVHGADVAVVDADTEPGTELRGVDAAVTDLPGRPLTVLVADCVPLLAAGRRAIGVAHAGRAGLVAGVVPAVLWHLEDLGDAPARLRVILGPAIGGCCYEVPSTLRDEVATAHPSAAGETSWGTPSLDLPAAVTAELRAAGVRDVRRVGGCTRCDPERRWFSHRADPAAGRQIGLIVRQGVPT